MTKKKEKTFETCLEETKLSLVDHGKLNPMVLGYAVVILQTKELVLSFFEELIKWMMVKDRCTSFALDKKVGMDGLELYLKKELKIYMKRIILLPLKANKSGLPDVWFSAINEWKVAPPKTNIKTDFLTKFKT